MSKTTTHYLASGKAYTGPVHKMGRQVMTGATHTPSSGARQMAYAKPKPKGKGGKK